MNREFIADSVWAIVAVAGIVLALVVAFAYYAKFEKSKHFQKVLAVVMGIGVSIVLGISVLTWLNPGPCTYQFETPNLTLGFEPQRVEVKYGARSGCPANLYIRIGEGSELNQASVTLHSKTVAGREYYSTQFELPGNYSDGPRTIEVRAPNAEMVSITQLSALEGLSGDRREAVRVALELYRRRVPFLPDPKYSKDHDVGKNPNKSFDGSGYIAYVLAKAGVFPEIEVLMKYSRWELRNQFGTPEIRSTIELQTGDLVFEDNGACWFVLSKNQVVGMTAKDNGPTIANPSSLGTPIIGYGRVPYPN